MRRGERARIWVPPELGYGAAGSFSFPTVPPNSALVYDLSLLEWEAPDDDKARVWVLSVAWCVGVVCGGVQGMRSALSGA